MWFVILLSEYQKVRAEGLYVDKKKLRVLKYTQIQPKKKKAGFGTEKKIMQ